MQVELRPLNSIKPYDRNPRKNDSAVDAAAMSPDEEWRTVPGYAGLYEVSSYGRVRRSSKSRMAPAGYVLKPGRTWDGYPKYSLHNRGRCWCTKVHRIVALAFLGQPPFARAHVAHYDGDKMNNTVGNLRWATAAENEEDKRRHGRVRAPAGETHHLARLTVEAVSAMRRRVSAGEGLVAVARAFNIPVATAHNAVHGVTWRLIKDPPPLGALRWKR